MKELKDFFDDIRMMFEYEITPTEIRVFHNNLNAYSRLISTNKELRDKLRLGMKSRTINHQRVLREVNLIEQEEELQGVLDAWKPGLKR